MIKNLRLPVSMLLTAGGLRKRTLVLLYQSRKNPSLIGWTKIFLWNIATQLKRVCLNGTRHLKKLVLKMLSGWNNNPMMRAGAPMKPIGLPSAGLWIILMEPWPWAPPASIRAQERSWMQISPLVMAGSAYPAVEHLSSIQNLCLPYPTHRRL